MLYFSNIWQYHNSYSNVKRGLVKLQILGGRLVFFPCIKRTLLSILNHVVFKFLSFYLCHHFYKTVCFILLWVSYHSPSILKDLKYIWTHTFFFHDLLILVSLGKGYFSGTSTITDGTVTSYTMSSLFIHYK